MRDHKRSDRNTKSDTRETISRSRMDQLVFHEIGFDEMSAVEIRLRRKKSSNLFSSRTGGRLKHLILTGRSDCEIRL